MTRGGRRAAIYVRISTGRVEEEQRLDGLGTANQEEECRELAERLGLQVVAVHLDDDNFAHGWKRRPGYVALLEDVRSGRVDVVLACTADRLYRRPPDLEELIAALEAADVDVCTARSGLVDLTTSSGRAAARIFGAMATMESERKAGRMRSAHIERALRGEASGGGSRPFGYRANKITVDSAEADAVRWAAARVLEGWSLTRTAVAMPMLTTRGKAWTPTSLRRVLLSARVAGLRSHHPNGRDAPPTTTPAAWPAILDEQTWQAVAIVLQDPARRTWRQSRKYLLTGLVFTTDGERMEGRPDSRKRRRYVQRDGRCNIGAEPLENLLVEAVLQLSDSTALMKKAANVDPGLGDHPVMRRPPAEPVDAMRAQLPPVGTTPAESLVLAVPGDLRRSWDRIEHETRRYVLTLVIERIEIAPARRGLHHVDPERVTITWRA